VQRPSKPDCAGSISCAGRMGLDAGGGLRECELDLDLRLATSGLRSRFATTIALVAGLQPGSGVAFSFVLPPGSCHLQRKIAAR